MSQVAAMLRDASEIRARLRNPPNAVRDDGIDLKRPKVIPIKQLDEPQEVPVTSSWDVFGPKLPSADDIAFGPVVHPGEKEPIERATVMEIQRVVCRYYAITRGEMLSQRRTAGIVRPRQVAMYLTKRLTLRSYPDIGRRFGGRDHSTVMAAVKRIERLRLHNATLDEDLAELESMFVAFPSQTEDAACSTDPAGQTS